MPAPSASPDRTALVIDDEETLCRLVARILEQSGYRVLTAGDGRRGVALFREQTEPVDLVLLDVVLPGPGPEELLPQLRAEGHDPTIILMSGDALPDALAGELERPRSRFLRKPFVPRTLRRVLKEVTPGVPKGGVRSAEPDVSGAPNGAG